MSCVGIEVFLSLCRKAKREVSALFLAGCEKVRENARAERAAPREHLGVALQRDFQQPEQRARLALVHRGGREIRLHQLAQHLPKLLFHGRPRGERGVAFHGIAPAAGRVRLQQPLELLQILLEGRRHAPARGGGLRGRHPRVAKCHDFQIARHSIVKRRVPISMLDLVRFPVSAASAAWNPRSLRAQRVTRRTAVLDGEFPRSLSRSRGSRRLRSARSLSSDPC